MTVVQNEAYMILMYFDKTRAQCAQPVMKPLSLLQRALNIRMKENEQSKQHCQTPWKQCQVSSQHLKFWSFTSHV